MLAALVQLHGRGLVRHSGQHGSGCLNHRGAGMQKLLSRIDEVQLHGGIFGLNQGALDSRHQVRYVLGQSTALRVQLLLTSYVDVVIGGSGRGGYALGGTGGGLFCTFF